MATTFVMVIGTSLAGGLIFFCGDKFQIEFSSISMLWAVIFAALMIPYYVLGVKVLSLGSLAVYSMFMMLGGMLVPFFYGTIFLHEKISVGKIIGTILLISFIVLQAVAQRSSNEQSKGGKKKYLFFVLCLIIFFVNGMTGVIAKAHSISEGAVSEVSFTTTYCIMTAILGV